MSKLITRLILAVALSLCLSTAGVNSSDSVLQTLFTILGIVFSIGMSLLVSFNLSQIRNKSIRNRIRSSINNTIHLFVVDFIVTSLIFMCSILMYKKIAEFSISTVKLNVIMIGICTTTISLIYEVCNFQRIHKLNVDIEEKILEETEKHKGE